MNVLYMRDWSLVADSAITQGEYLAEFLTDYQKTFGGDINPSCPSCLNEYIRKFKKHIMRKTIIKEHSDYVLLAKREGLPLEFGSPILVTNKNITNEYAVKLFDRLKEINPTLEMSEIFREFPITKPAGKKASEPTADTDKAKKSFLRKNKEECLKIAFALGIELDPEGDETKEEIYEMVEKAKTAINTEPVLVTPETPETPETPVTPEVIDTPEATELVEELEEEVIDELEEEDIFEPLTKDEEVIDLEDNKE